MTDDVYFQPEEPGESGKWFKRDGKGLGLCNISICPHLQMIKNFSLDGYSLVYDPIRKDSINREIIGLDDGSYIYIDDKEACIYGSATLIKDGVFSTLCNTDDSFTFDVNNNLSSKF